MNTTRKASTEPYVDVGTVARLLGVPRSFVYDRTARGQIPCYRVGRLLRFKISEVERWLAEGSPPPARRQRG